jgi:probable HAF family extracellular repeat protein
MKTLDSCFHALSIGAAAAILAACGGNQSATPQLPATSGLGNASNGASRVVPPKRSVRYNITDLGTLGGSFSEAVGISNRGGVSGYSTLPGDSVIHAFYWQGNAMTDLGTLGGPNSFAPEGEPPNDSGDVAGMSDTSAYDPYYDNFCGLFDFQPTSPYICAPFVWRHGSMTALPTLGGPNAAAFEINDRGASVGTSETTIGPCGPFAFYFDGVIWGRKKGEIKTLPPLSGDDASIAGAINDKNEAVGTSGTCAAGGIEAVLWRNSTPINLGTLGGAVFNGAFAVNNRTEIVGQSDLYGDYTHHAFLWRKGKMTDLGSISGLVASLGAGINNKTQVVGFSQEQYGYTTVPWLWQRGTMTDLNTLIPRSSPWFFVEALGINDRGQIVGYAYNPTSGEVHAVLAAPCGGPKPGPGGCDDARARKSRTIALPKSVQNMLRRLHFFNRFDGWRRR